MSNKNLNSGDEVYQALKNYVQNLDKKENNSFAFQQACAFLLLLWNYFVIYCEEEEGGETTRGQKSGKKIKEKDTYLIIDYGNYLITSVGDYYGSYSTKRLIRSVQRMIEMIAEKGIKKVRFLGTPVAERVAQEACEKYNLRYDTLPKKGIYLDDKRIGSPKTNPDKK
ncbi:hypothetical protein [Rickettsiella massiliensis]|uniref:hypothetical protein n=1 Tax=Rickettsiella massiliensis TaxID=676517 RepID=UPI00029A2F98|nr:hypothetical protein [Rickettsiella massiliensis]